MTTFFSLELITEAASNSVMVFFFCNLIIVTILVASSSASPSSTTSGMHHVSMAGTPYYHVTIHQQEETLVLGAGNDALFSSDENRASWSLSSPSEPKLGALATTAHQDVEKEEADCSSGGAENGKEHCNDNDDEEEEEDELRRRVEEFIEKTNKEWRAELLRTSKSRLMIAG